MKTVSYNEHLAGLPSSGKHIVGQFDKHAVVVYQEFNRQIAEPALQHQKFVSPFCFDRLSWIKTNFMWMMFRSDWGRFSDYVLAIHIKRGAFETILQRAVPAKYDRLLYTKPAQWRKDLKQSDIRYQWDPEHDPYGKRMHRKALQIGLSGEALRQYATEWIVEIRDVTSFVHAQLPAVKASDHNKLQVPLEKVFTPQEDKTSQKLTLSTTYSSPLGT